MALVEMEMDAPEGAKILGYERIGEGHAFEIEWDLPEQFTCRCCGRCEPPRVEHTDKVQVIRDLDVWEQPSFFVYQAVYHRCGHCNRRQWFLPPFKRKDVTYTFRFEEQVLRLLIGSTEEEVARRLGISAELVGTIVKHRLKDEQHIDSDRKITDVGMDEISLKKRHKLYATILTDLTDPDNPRLLAVAPGRGQQAAEQCLNCLSEEQRLAVRVHRTDMSASFAAGCAAKLPHSQQTIDRFHVALRLGSVVDGVRKKDSCLQEALVGEGAEGVSLGDVGLSDAT